MQDAASSLPSGRALNEQVPQIAGSARSASAPSAKGPSIFALADLACAMPWEDKAPISARLDFKDAVTPELFVELVDALVIAESYLLPRVLGTGGDGDRRVLPILRAAIVKARGEKA